MLSYIVWVTLGKEREVKEEYTLANMFTPFVSLGHPWEVESPTKANSTLLSLDSSGNAKNKSKS